MGGISKEEEGRISGANSRPVEAGGNAPTAIRPGRWCQYDEVGWLETSRTFQKCKARSYTGKGVWEICGDLFSMRVDLVEPVVGKPLTFKEVGPHIYLLFSYRSGFLPCSDPS